MGWTARVGTFVSLVVLGLAVRVVPFRLIARWLVRGSGTVRAAAPGEVDALASTVARAAAWCRPYPGCLLRSLVLARLLIRRGLDADLVVGIRTQDGRLAAHAWVECEGRQIDLASGSGQPSSDFSVLCRLGPSVAPAGTTADLLTL